MMMLFVENTQMAGLCRMTLTLVLLLSAGKSLAGVDKNHLARIVNEMLYRWVDFL